MFASLNHFENVKRQVSENSCRLKREEERVIGRVVVSVTQGVKVVCLTANCLPVKQAVRGTEKVAVLSVCHFHSNGCGQNCRASCYRNSDCGQHFKRLTDFVAIKRVRLNAVKVVNVNRVDGHVAATHAITAYLDFSVSAESGEDGCEGEHGKTAVYLVPI